MSQVVYDKINARILESLAQGVAPWRKPWTAKRPINAVSGKPYRGINQWLLPVDDFTDHRWLTFKQAKELGGHVRSGQHGSMIVFWTMKTVHDSEKDIKADDQSKEVPILRWYTVFNVEQCDGLRISVELGKDNQALTTPESIIAGMSCPPRQATSRIAAFSPATDTVYMPQRWAFDSSEAYYSVLFHEYVHSTGMPNRLDRFDATQPVAPFGSEDYSREELVAEFGSAFLCGIAGIESMTENSAAYIAGWTKAIQNDSRMLITAASKAQKAADYILGTSDDHTEAA